MLGWLRGGKKAGGDVAAGQALSPSSGDDFGHPSPSTVGPRARSRRVRGRRPHAAPGCRCAAPRGRPRRAMASS